jgi:hypothetical protein
MNIALIPQLVVSSSRGWPELEKSRPSVGRLFFLMVLPLAALPPLLLHYAGTHYGDAFFDKASSLPWTYLSMIFFLAEIVTFAAMGWWIRECGLSRRVEISLHDAYLLAAIAPVPLWLSSLALLVPSLAFCVAAALLAMAVSAAIVYHGAYALAHMRDEIVAATIANETVAAGGLAWLLLLLVIALPIAGA